LDPVDASTPELHSPIPGTRYSTRLGIDRALRSRPI
jgi:hypothetical protein